jgi:branched-subunit amino acid transport protein
MTSSALLFLIVIIGLLTFSIRLSFVLLAEWVEMPYFVHKLLRFVPVAVLTALVAPALLYHDGVLNLSWRNERLLAGLVAIVIVVYTRNTLLTLGVGMLTLWVLQALMG